MGIPEALFLIFVIVGGFCAIDRTLKEILEELRNKKNRWE